MIFMIIRRNYIKGAVALEGGSPFYFFPGSVAHAAHLELEAILCWCCSQPVDWLPG